MKKIFLLLWLCFAGLTLTSQNVVINGNKFNVSGNEIWFNGINTPWHLFDDFGRTDFNAEWWDTEFEKYAANNINLARVWIHGSGEISPDIDETGYVSGADNLFWEHMDTLMAVAARHKVYVMPALLSFDITRDKYTTSERWRLFVQSAENIQSYIDNVLIPLVQRYENETYLLAWEICNEPEWMFENSEHGPQSFDDIQRLHALLAAAIHKNSSAFVTTGSAAPKWNSPIYDSWGDNEGNMFSDEALAESAGDESAYLDFYQYHWYPWQTEWMDSPFTKTTEYYEVDDRPVIVGESEGNDVCDDFICQTVSEMYENAYLNGFDGVCAWKTPQNDGHGTFENIAVATNNFYSNHPLLVYPDADPVAVESIDIELSSVEMEVGDSKTLSYTILPSNASDKSVSWSSSNEAIATVNAALLSAIDTGTVTITATTTDGNFTDSCIVTITAATPVETYTLIVNTIDNGSVELDPDSDSYEEGSSISLSANADSGYSFQEWSGDITGTSADTTITINADMQISATFVEAESPCDSPEAITSLPFSFDGSGEYCWVIDGDINNINSWNMNTLEINGVDYTNEYSADMPDKIDGYYYIHYIGDYDWSHFEMTGTLKSATIPEINGDLAIKLSPNPFTNVITVNINSPEKVKMITIVDASGRVMDQISSTKITTSMQIGSSLTKGIYYLSIYTKDNNIKTLVIQKK